MGGSDVRFAVIVGDGSCHLEDAVVGTGREVELGHGALYHGERLVVELTILTKQGRGHLRIAMDARLFAETLLLNLTRLDDTFADGCTAFSHARTAHLSKA